MNKLLHVSITKKMISHTLVALIELAVRDTGMGTITEDRVGDEFAELDEEEEEDKEEGPAVLEVELTEAEVGVVAPPAVPDGASLS